MKQDKLTFEFGWLVGLLEGECCFGYYGSTQRVSIEMTDEDTMIRVAEIFSVLCNHPITIREFDRPNRVNRENHSSMYRVQLTGEKARTIMRIVVPYMSKRRRIKIWQALNGYTEKKISLADTGINLGNLRLVKGI